MIFINNTSKAVKFNILNSKQILYLKMIDSSSIGGGGSSNIFPQNLKNSSYSITVGFEYLRYGMKVHT